MLLAELLGDDLKNSLYAKTKDYYTEGSKDAIGEGQVITIEKLYQLAKEGRIEYSVDPKIGHHLEIKVFPSGKKIWVQVVSSTKDIDLGKMLTGLVDFAYEGISEDSKSMDDDSDRLKRYRKAYPEDKRSDSEILQDLNDDKTYKI